MILLDHIVLNANDVAKTIAFYVDLLDVSIERWEAYVAGEVEFPSLRLSETCIIDVFPPSLWKREAQLTGQPNLDHFCLALTPPRWDEIYHKLASQDLILRGPSQNFGAQGTGTSVYVSDPDGTVVELKKY